MQIDFVSDCPVTDAACFTTTGKTMKAWFAELDNRPDINRKRRDAIRWVYDEIGKSSPDVWWPTTIWVEYERVHGIVNKKDGRAEGYNICVTKTIAASVEEVYAAWTTPKQLLKWFGAKAKSSAKDGGTFDDGDGSSGKFLRVRENKDLRFTWNHQSAEAETLVDVAFADKGKGKTGITLMHQRLQNRKDADGLRNAWGAAFDRLKAMLES